MYITRTVGQKGQVVVPQPIRQQTRIQAGTEVVFDVEGEKIIIRKKEDPRSVLEEFFNIVPKKKKLKGKIDFYRLEEGEYRDRFPILLGR